MPAAETLRVSVMTAGFWLASLLGTVIVGLLCLIWFGEITGSDARDLFLVMGLPILVLLGFVVGVLLQRYVHETNQRP